MHHVLTIDLQWLTGISELEPLFVVFNVIYMINIQTNRLSYYHNKWLPLSLYCSPELLTNVDKKTMNPFNFQNQTTNSFELYSIFQKFY